MDGAWAFAGAVVVSLVTLVGNIIISKRDKVATRLTNIEVGQALTGAKLDLGNRGTMTSLKIQLQQTHERQRAKVRSKSDRWSPELDQVFREAYVIYKQLEGNGIVDRLRKDMDVWRDRFAGEIYVEGKENT